MNSFNKIVKRMNRNPPRNSTKVKNFKVSGDQSVSPPWSDLPSPAVEKIYSFLNRTDQVSMSLVCRNWHEDYTLPSLWRKVTFRFPDIENNKLLVTTSTLSGTLAMFFRVARKKEMYRELCPEVYSARTCGAMFRHVEIALDFPLVLDAVLDKPISVPDDGQLNQLFLFLEAVTRHSQLLSVSFKYRMCRSMIGYEEVIPDIYKKLLKLLRSQKKLRRVEFMNSQLKKAEAAEVLNVILANNYQTLRCLNLRGFVVEKNPDGFEDYTVDDDLNYMVLMNLEELEIDYTQMFENMILSFYEYRNKVDIGERKGRLKKIALSCHNGAFSEYLGLQPLVWDYLRNIFPDLKVELMIKYQLPDFVNFSTYIVPLMPIRVLQIIFDGVQMTKIDELLRHIISCNINKSIEDLKVVLRGISSNFAPDLMRFTNVCPKLQTLDIVLKHSILELCIVFNSLLEHRSVSLHVVKIAIRLVPTEEQKTLYSNLIDFYARKLQPLELSLSFDVNKKPFENVEIGRYFIINYDP